MTLLPLLTCAAVPCGYPDYDRSIAARRFRSRRLRQEFEGSRELRQQVDRHLLLTTAAEAFEDAATSEPAAHNSHTPAKAAALLRQPPNTPAAAVAFEFPDVVNEEDGLESNPVAAADALPAAEDEQSSSSESSGSNRPRSKRRRPPSFKKNRRVPPKKKFSCPEEADDEASSDEENWENRVELSELCLRLNVLSEVRKTLRQEAEAAPGGRTASEADWARVGVELRQIADCFCATESDDDEMNDEDNDNTVDVMALVNSMLPFSMPQSLWSAIVSYAAWKILKKFQ